MRLLVLRKQPLIRTYREAHPPRVVVPVSRSVGRPCGGLSVRYPRLRGLHVSRLFLRQAAEWDRGVDVHLGRPV